MNYLKLGTSFFKNSQYLFFDTEDYLADNILYNHKIPVKFGKEYAHKDYPYVIVVCKIKNRYSAEFEKCMHELENKMLICGHNDYINFCEESIRQFQKTIKEMRAS